RNHTEMMLKAMGANIEIKTRSIHLAPSPYLYSRDIYIPGDISSAAFFLTAALLVPHSSIIMKDIGINNTRSGILDIYKKMGADIKIDNIIETGGELKGDIRASSSDLKATTIEGDVIPKLIDEIPIIALAATQAIGTTI